MFRCWFTREFSRLFCTTRSSYTFIAQIRICTTPISFSRVTQVFRFIMKSTYFGAHCLFRAHGAYDTFGENLCRRCNVISLRMIAIIASNIIVCRVYGDTCDHLIMHSCQII